MANPNNAPIQQIDEQQAQQQDPLGRSVVNAAKIALRGVEEQVPPLELPDGRIVPGNIILGSS